MPTITASATENEMIATFLRGELASSRFGERLAQCIQQLGLAVDLVTSPDLADEAANHARRDLLTHFRGWGSTQSVFGGLPAERTDWVWVELSKRDLIERVFYIQYFWEAFSGGTRRPAQVAERVRRGDVEVGLEIYQAILADVRRGNMPTPPILVSNPVMERLVILEGHLRITAYLVEPDVVPFPIRALLGLSDNINEWSEW
jgi:hypothetical protein